MKILVSACLLGENCRYDGGNNLIEKIKRLEEKHEIYPFCPEVEGGAPIPRIPCEIVNHRVVDKEGNDLTDLFMRGAESTLRLVQKERIEAAILKQRSPSCGYGKIYDGSFSGNIIIGNGITADLLAKKGVKIFTEEDFQEEFL